MWDLRERVKLQIPFTRMAQRATWGQLLAPQSFTSLHCSHLHHILWTCEDARTCTKPTHHILPLWNFNPKASVYQVCRSWSTLTNARWMQSILIIPKCPHCHSIITNLKWNQIVAQNHRCSGILDVRQSPAALSRYGSQGVRLWLRTQI